MTEYRASFDATVRFSNGGDLAVHGFRVDVPGPGIDQAGIGALFVASLGLLMTETVELSNVAVFAEPHKGTRGGPADRGVGQPSPAGRGVGQPSPAGRLVELPAPCSPPCRCASRAWAPSPSAPTPSSPPSRAEAHRRACVQVVINRLVLPWRKAA
jgi:hypothetical protein